ncbi:winged helix-turn-helix domain-containing protein [Pararoseomonas baculiformis]|uniref:winged helix-turn-helix domain-containing protein n=1 Tax=Pararoseomonas baculiformis TaxID=2820812 RepID=UPI0038CFDC33
MPMLCRWIEERLGKHLHPDSLSRVVRELDLSREKTRPRHPGSDEGAKVAFAKGLCRAVAEVAADHPGRRIGLWFQDEARVGQKGRTGHR